MRSNDEGAAEASVGTLLEVLAERLVLLQLMQSIHPMDVLLERAANSLLASTGELWNVLQQELWENADLSHAMARFGPFRRRALDARPYHAVAFSPEIAVELWWLANIAPFGGLRMTTANLSQDARAALRAHSQRGSSLALALLHNSGMQDGQGSQQVQALDKLVREMRELAASNTRLSENWASTNEVMSAIARVLQDMPKRESLDRLASDIEQLKGYLHAEQEAVSETRLPWPEGAELELPVFIGVQDKEVSKEQQEVIATAVAEFVHALGLNAPPRGRWNDRVGSWFSGFIAKMKAPKTKEAAVEVLKKGERALTAQFVRGPEAEADAKLTDATANMIRSLESVSDAMVVVGGSMLVKQTVGARSSVFAVPLTQGIRERMEVDPACTVSPQAFLEMVREVGETARARLAPKPVPESIKEEIQPTDGATGQARPA